MTLSDIGWYSVGKWNILVNEWTVNFAYEAYAAHQLDFPVHGLPLHTRHCSFVMYSRYIAGLDSVPFTEQLLLMLPECLVSGGCQ